MTELFQFTLFGLMLGCIYAIAAMGLVLTYTVTGVFNFAHGAVGMMAAFCYYELRVRRGLPAPVAVAAAVVGLAPAMGVVVERLLRRFRDADFAVSLVVTVALTIGLLGLSQQIFDPREERFVPFLFGYRRIEVLGVPVSYDRLAQVAIAAAVAFGLRLLLFGTNLGARMRAVVDDHDLAQLNGVRSTAVARLGWMMGFALAALGGVLFSGGQNLNAVVLTLLVLNAYGAAMVGRLTSLPLTAFGGLLLGLCQELTSVTWLWPQDDTFARIRLAIPGIFLIVALLPVPSVRLRAGRAVGRDEPRSPSLRSSLLGAAALVAVVALTTEVTPESVHIDVARALIMAVIALSLVVLTGLSGQVSLTQYLFVGIGAFVGGKFFGGASIHGLLFGGLAAAVLGALITLPAVRLQGLHLALATFAIALVGREAILGDPRILGVKGLVVRRPEVFGVATLSDGAYAVWCAVVFSVLALAVGAVRRGRLGRQLAAVRDSERASAMIGIRVRTVKVATFAFSSFIAGCAGVLFGSFSGAVQSGQFEPVYSLVVVLFAYVGGITSVLGALVAGALFALLSHGQSSGTGLAGLVFLTIGAAAISLGRQPNGIAGMILDAWERRRSQIQEWRMMRVSTSLGGDA